MTTDADVSEPRILTPDQRPRVFISSTLQELAAERVAARAAVERLRLIPVLFELGARPHAARALYRAYLEQSHVFVAIYFEKYGWVAPGESISGLEDEYRLSGTLPRLVYLKAPAPDRDSRLSELLDTLREDDTVSYKSFESAEDLEQLLAADLAVLLAERFLLGTPDSAPAENAPAAPAHPVVRPVPAPFNSLVGRDSELAEIDRLVAAGARMVTLVGPGGIGKSRLALEAAGRASALHPDQVAFVSLETVNDPDAVLPTIAASIGLGLDGGVPALDALERAFGDRSFVLVVDNFEQVLPAAAQVAELLSRCPGLTVVVTSRAALRIRAETLLPVGPLSLPSSERSDSAAVQLFVERAQGVRPGFTLDDPAEAAAVAELCQRLDGIPLAIEVAAGRSRLLPPRALLERLGSALDIGTGAADLPVRQRTLRDTLAWSEQLLSPEQRSLLAALSVFSAPWTLADAGHVAPSDVSDLLDAVAALVENSLVVPVTTAPGEPRFQMYNTVRAYASERLDALGARSEAEDRFCARMIAQVPAIATGVRTREQARWRAEFRMVWPDLRQAWALAVQADDGERTAAASQLVPVLWLEGRSNEVVDLVADSVLVGLRTRPARHGDLMLMAANSAFYLGDYDKAAELLAHFGTDDVPWPVDPAGRATISLVQGYLAANTVDLDAAEHLLSDCLTRLQGNESSRWIAAFAHNGMGSLTLVRGDVQQALLEFETSRRVAAESGNLGAQMQALVFTASVRLFEGDTDVARTLLLEATDLVEQQPYYEGNAYCLEVAAAHALAAGDATAAARALGQAHALRELIGARVWSLLEQMSERVHAGVLGVLGDAAFAEAYADGRAADPRSAAVTIRALLGA